MKQLPDEIAERAKEELARRAALQIARIRDTPEYLDAVARMIVGGLHAKQREVWTSIGFGLRFIAACCSRRAGKTHLAAAVIVLKLLRARYGQEVVFCAPTLARGKELIWAEVVRMIQEYHLGWKMTANTGRIYTNKGALFRIVGLDNKRQIGKISRGGNTVLFVTDETQEYPHLLQQLMVGAGPALAQSRGAFLALGTPSSNDSDYWSQLCDGAEGFTAVHWWMGDNPHLGRPASEIIEEEKTRHGWDDNHPTLIREYYGRRCKDASNLVLEFNDSKNIAHEVPGYDLKTWRHFIGIDFGLRDATAWVVLAAPPHDRSVYVVHCELATNLTWDDVADTTKTLCERFKPKGVVGDAASGGAQFLQTFNRRYGKTVGVTARSAQKHDKPASIAVINTELRTGRLKFLHPACSQLTQEATALQWANAERTLILEGAAYPEDLFDAFRYGFNEFHAYSHGKRPEGLPEEERRRLERNERERQRQAFSRAGGW